jgi:hypothetical protein
MVIELFFTKELSFRGAYFSNASEREINLRDRDFA